MLKSISAIIKNIFCEPLLNDEIYNYFRNEYKKNARAAYGYWAATGNFNFES